MVGDAISMCIAIYKVWLTDQEQVGLVYFIFSPRSQLCFSRSCGNISFCIRTARLLVNPEDVQLEHQF